QLVIIRLLSIFAEAFCVSTMQLMHNHYTIKLKLFFTMCMEINFTFIIVILVKFFSFKLEKVGNLLAMDGFSQNLERRFAKLIAKGQDPVDQSPHNFSIETISKDKSY